MLYINTMLEKKQIFQFFFVCVSDNTPEYSKVFVYIAKLLPTVAKRCYIVWMSIHKATVVVYIYCMTTLRVTGCRANPCFLVYSGQPLKGLIVCWYWWHGLLFFMIPKKENLLSFSQLSRTIINSLESTGNSLPTFQPRQLMNGNKEKKHKVLKQTTNTPQVMI